MTYRTQRRVPTQYLLTAGRVVRVGVTQAGAKSRPAVPESYRRASEAIADARSRRIAEAGAVRKAEA
jgi:hypothetical protein